MKVVGQVSVGGADGVGLRHVSVVRQQDVANAAAFRLAQGILEQGGLRRNRWRIELGRGDHERNLRLDETRNSRALGKQHRVAAEVGNPALALLILREIVPTRREYRASEPGALGTEKLRMRHVG